VEVQGDAELAADVSWLVANLRWDIEDDLERAFGPAPAHEIVRIGTLFGQGLRSALNGLAGLRAAK
jgi:ubiquinone biosynthesis protein UbiJ